MPVNIVTPQSIKTFQAVCVAAKTTYGDAANAVRLIASADLPKGGLIKRLTAMPRSTVTATQLQAYQSANAGVTLLLLETALMPAHTVSSTTAIPRTTFEASPDYPVRLEAGDEFFVAIAVALAAGIVFQAEVEAF